MASYVVLYTEMHIILDEESDCVESLRLTSYTLSYLTHALERVFAQEMSITPSIVTILNELL